jgi:hypothetical protein
LTAFGTPDYDPDLTIPNQATIGRVTRYTLDQSTGFTSVIPGSRKIILGDRSENGLAILMTSHAVGTIAFGLDGSILLSFGDGGSFSEDDGGNANDTYHEQAIQDGIIREADNVGSFRAMQLNNPHGKILRIDPETGMGLPSNPFYDVDNPDAFISKVWALGFRNPYKFIVLDNTGSHNIEDGDPGTLIVGDVGSSVWEEINVVDQPGDWYGWPFWEGYEGKWGFWGREVQNPDAPNPLACEEYFTFTDLRKNENEAGAYTFANPCDQNKTIPDDVKTLVHRRPIMAYSSAKWNPPAKTRVPTFDEEGRASSYSILDTAARVEGQVIEGGSIIPSVLNTYDGLGEDYKDKYFFADYHGFIATMELNDDLSIKSTNPFLTTTEGITDLAFNPNTGTLYYIHLLRGELRKVSFGGVLPPTIITEIDKPFGPSPLAVSFDASQTISHAGEELSFEWELGNGTIKTGEVINHTFSSTDVAAFPVTLTVKDESDRTSIRKYTISVNNTPPVAKISSIVDSSTYAINDYSVLSLQATVEDAEHELSELAYEWRVDLYHDTHFHPGPIDRKPETYAFVDPLGCGLEAYWYKILLTVTDPTGLQSRDTVSIFPYCGPTFTNFTDFSAKVIDDKVQLDWELDNTSQISSFIVEHTDLYLFKPIGEEDKVSGTNNYSFVHTMPFQDKNYYRIKAFDLEGNAFYSPIVEAQVIIDMGFSVYPNPATSTITVSLTNAELHQPVLRIVDITGRLLQEHRLPDNVIIEESIDISDLSSGVYFLNVKVGDREMQSKVLVY